MFDKVNVSRIVIDHVATFRDYSKDRCRPTDFLLFFGIPAANAGVLIYFYGNIRPSLIGIVATSLSIFAALLFNLLLLVYDAMGKSGKLNGNTDGLRRRFLREVFSNISFAILVAISAIVSVLAVVIVNACSAADYVFSVLVYYLVTLFLLTLLMLLKRVHILLRHESEE